MKQILEENPKLGIIIFGYFTGPSPFRKDLSGSFAKAVAMNKGKMFTCTTDVPHSRKEQAVVVKNVAAWVEKDD